MRVILYSEYTRSSRTLSAIAVAAALERRGLSVKWTAPCRANGVDLYWDDGHVRQFNDRKTYNADVAVWFGNLSGHYCKLRAKVKAKHHVIVPDIASMRVEHLKALPQFNTVVAESPESANQLRQMLVLRNLNHENVRSCRWDATMYWPGYHGGIGTGQRDPAICFYATRNTVRNRGAWLLQCMEALSTTPVNLVDLPIHLFCETAPSPQMTKRLEACPGVQCYFGVPFDVLFSTMTKMTFFVYGGPHPGTGVLLRTAMSQGAIPVMSAVKPARRMIIDRVDGLLIPPRNLETSELGVEQGLMSCDGLADILGTALQHPRTMQHLQANGLARSSAFDPPDEQFSNWWADQVLGFRPAKV